MVLHSQHASISGTQRASWTTLGPKWTTGRRERNKPGNGEGLAHHHLLHTCLLPHCSKLIISLPPPHRPPLSSLSLLSLFVVFENNKIKD